ncbi:hypothetical protein [Gaetbulibacter sp. PBL-D1]|uniref:hypothetical protein n=1 Tax=Gaetbulibacter sp. PBL-D1 TaxID=3422594 RepID=UPI003D2ED422
MTQNKIKIKTLLIGFLTLLISCNKRVKKTEINKVETELDYLKRENLNYDQFKGTKWIIGEIGLNGEKPDTIIFDNPKTLTYISTDTGKESCNFSFENDTLVFKSYGTEYDLETDKEITSESINKFHYQNNTFKFIFCYQKKATEKEFRITNMEKYNLIFRQIK